MKTIFVFLAEACSVMMVKGQADAICPAGEHQALYCPKMAEPSCDNPKLHEPLQPIPCGTLQCFCNPPTIRNTLTGECVLLKDSICPVGEHRALYCPKMAEPSCDNPKLHELLKPIPCGILQCFCNPPTIRNTLTGECVLLKDCKLQ